MASLTPTDAVLSVGQRIGRYFALVSMIPSLFLVIWVYLLFASGAVTGKPAFRNVETALSHWSVGKVAGLVLATLAIALVLHPLQFATTQLLEGYWGTTPLAIAAMKVRKVHHRRRCRDLKQIAGRSQRQLIAQAERLIKDSSGPYDEPVTVDEDAIDGLLESKRGDRLMLYVAATEEAADHAARYPSDAARIMPTELGNALRRFEDAAGSQYGLDAITISPHLHLVASPRHLEYLVDARQEMDAAIRICTVGLLAAALTAGALFTDGIWLLWATLPYFVSYLAYKGAVSAAQNYGGVFQSVLDLGRFQLYKELGLYPPRDSVEELANNRELMKLLTNNGNDPIRYRRDIAT
ncbi:MAG: hypothetical protein ACLPKE_00095 [Streptosporangiaceae bacterium]